MLAWGLQGAFLFAGLSEQGDMRDTLLGSPSFTAGLAAKRSGQGHRGENRPRAGSPDSVLSLLDLEILNPRLWVSVSPSESKGAGRHHHSCFLFRRQATKERFCPSPFSP